MTPIHTLTTALLLATLTGCVLPSDKPPVSNPTPETPVYNFGDGYALIQSDSLPRLQSDSLYVEVRNECNGGAVTLEHFKTSDSTYEVWLNMHRPIQLDCAIPFFETHVVKVPDAVAAAQSVVLVTTTNERIELKD